MTVDRKFLGWDRPVVINIRDELMPEKIDGPVDLESTLIVVPTQQAGRRLREELARFCAEKKSAMLSPNVVQPVHFLRSDHPRIPIAGQAVVMALWSRVLLQAQVTELKGLFPEGIAHRDFSWALYTGKLIQTLRNDLVDGGYLIQDVLKRSDVIREESERWKDLAKLEETYLNRINSMHLQDPCVAMIQQACEPTLPDKIKRIIIASVPDPTPLTIKAIEKLSEQVPVTILIHAPETQAGAFDAWGRPDLDHWEEAPIKIPDPETNMVPCGNPLSQSRKVIEIMAEESATFGPLDIAIGVPDPDVISPVSAELETQGLPVFDPAGKPVRLHPTFHLLELVQAMIRDRSYTTIAKLLRHPDILYHLKEKHALSPLDVLEEWDRYQNEHLPLYWESIQKKILGAERGDRSPLHTSATFIQDCFGAFETNDLVAAVQQFLQQVYGTRTLNPEIPDEEDFINVARMIRESLSVFREKSIQDLALPLPDALEILVHQIAEQRFYPDSRKALIDLEGWLEIPWNDAPLLIVTGMNDGFVPDGRIQDIFLPDSVRRRLGLRHDEQRMSRDAYLMTSLIESRRADGRVCFLMGKNSLVGDPLTPSRLLFRCGDTELPARVKRLFGQQEEHHLARPSSISFKLDARPPQELSQDRLNLKTMTVTAFKDYLTCPFRFYLKRILNMNSLDDQKTELDALDFGTMIHYALQRMGKDPEMRQTKNEEDLSEFLVEQADYWISCRFGEQLPVPVRIQLNAAKQRLRYAAKSQTKLVDAGWEMLEVECKLEEHLSGMKILGMIDRVDRHRETGVTRILDYKTSESPVDPGKDHLSTYRADQADYVRMLLGKKEKAWTNLQLPLYERLYRMTRETKGPIQVGYFNLPKAVSETEINIWDSFDPVHTESAKSCVEGIIQAIQKQRFWPPSEPIRYDAYDQLFLGSAEDCFEAEAFKKHFTSSLTP